MFLKKYKLYPVILFSLFSFPQLMHAQTDSLFLTVDHITTVVRVFFPADVSFLFQVVHQVSQACFIFRYTLRQYLLADALFVP